MTDSRDPGGGETPRSAIPLASVTSVVEAMRLLDVYLQRERDWPLALNRYTLFRIPDFWRVFDGLMQEAIAAGKVNNEDEFIAAYRTHAREVSSKLHTQAGNNQWSDVKYSPQQLQHARRAEGMRFDKAVISVLALNRHAKRYGLCDKWWLPPHSIVACVFYFANLRGRLKKFAATKVANSDDEKMSLAIADVARATGQTEAVIDALAGELPARETKAEILKAVTTLASYSTQFAIYRFLLGHLPELANAKLEDIIVRRRVQTQSLEIIVDEVIVPFGRVTTGPYGWEADGVDDERMFPEGGPPPPKSLR